MEFSTESALACGHRMVAMTASLASYNPLMRWLALKTDSRIFLASLAFRVVNAMLVTVYFNPDEFWQNQEVAYSMVWGGAGSTWEWRQPAQIRGFAHVLPTALVYKLLQVLRLDYRWLIVCCAAVTRTPTHPICSPQASPL